MELHGLHFSLPVKEVTREAPGTRVYGRKGARAAEKLAAAPTE
jgi:hypothetical protein